MKRLLLLGAIAAAIYAFLTRQQKDSGESLESTANQVAAEAEGVVDKLKHQTDEAIKAGKEAAAEKEAEMLRRFEESKQ